MILKMTELSWLEGYCYFLDFLRIAYYPITNHIIGKINETFLLEVSRQLMASLGNNEAREITILSVNQLQCLYYQSRILDSITYQNKKFNIQPPCYSTSTIIYGLPTSQVIICGSTTEK